MGINRYSRDTIVKRWQRTFDDLQHRCHLVSGSPTVGDLLAHGIRTAFWQCRNTSWQNDGRGECWHRSESFSLARFGERLEVAKMRRLFVCSACGRNRPFLQLEANGDH